MFTWFFGQPLHAFDADKIAGKKVKVGVNDAGTKILTLDGVKKRLMVQKS